MWGADRNGVMGTGTLTGPYETGKEYHQPRQVGGLADVTQIASGEAHMLALKKDGTVWSWGWNKFGQVGLGDTEDRGRPTMVPGLTGVTRVYAVALMSAAQLADRSWRLWGKAGPVGVGTTDAFRPALEPKPLPAHLRTTFDLGGAVFLLRDGSVWTWGDNRFGTLGTGGDTGDYSTAGVQLKQLSGIVKVWSDGTRTLALKNDGTLYLWGPRFVTGNARVPMELGKFAAILTTPRAPRFRDQVPHGSAEPHGPCGDAVLRVGRVGLLPGTTCAVPCSVNRYSGEFESVPPADALNRPVNKRGPVNGEDGELGGSTEAGEPNHGGSAVCPVGGVLARRAARKRKPRRIPEATRGRGQPERQSSGLRKLAFVGMEPRREAVGTGPSSGGSRSDIIKVLTGIADS
jgi:hypothetical protein